VAAKRSAPPSSSKPRKTRKPGPRSRVGAPKTVRVRVCPGRALYREGRAARGELELPAGEAKALIAAGVVHPADEAPPAPPASSAEGLSTARRPPS
jgi:hypothetical protein